LWNRLGEIAKEYLSKGSRVYIEGKITTEKWSDRDGSDRYTTKIVAREMKMLSGRNDGGRGDNGGGYAPQAAPRTAPPSPPKAAQPADPFASQPDFGDIPADDDIPF